MRPGGSALTTDFTTLAEDLASHGYVVVGFDAPYRSGVVVFPDGRVVLRSPAANTDDLAAPGAQERFVTKILPMWSGDAQFVADQLDRLNGADPSGRFKGRLDMRRLGIFGHSFGGATALQFCHDDSRCKAGIDLDGEPSGSVVKEGLTQPFLFLLSDHGDLSAPEPHKVITDLESDLRPHPQWEITPLHSRCEPFQFQRSDSSEEPVFHQNSATLAKGRTGWATWAQNYHRLRAYILRRVPERRACQPDGQFAPSLA
jgi:dienelactone hydrolase